MSNFDWRGYHDLANELLEGHPVSNDEARYRTVISRAYYAALLVARDYVENEDWGLNIKVDDDLIHMEVPVWLEVEADRKKRS